MLTSIEVFRAGTHTAQNGKSYTFSEADIAQIAASYDPAVSAAPIVLGHPKTDDPAWGWAASFSVNEQGVLIAMPEKVDPAFAEGVEAGRYRYVSMALYEPTDARNPKPGCWYPRHVGYLGAQPPSVKGLKAAFSDEAGEVVAFSAPDPEIGWLARAVAQAFRRIRDFFLDEFGQEKADRVMPAWSDEWPAEIAAKVSAEQPKSDGAVWSEEQLVAAIFEHGKAMFAEAAQAEPAPEPPVADPAAAARQAELDAREADLQRRTAAFAEVEADRRRAEDVAFVDGLVTAGRLPPARRDGVLASLAHARGDDGGPAFAEGADAHGQLRELLGGLGVSIAFAELAADDGALVDRGDAAALAQRARALVAEARRNGETLSTADAVRRARAS